MICSLFLLNIILHFVSKSLARYQFCIQDKTDNIYNSVGIGLFFVNNTYAVVRKNRSPFCRSHVFPVTIYMSTDIAKQIILFVHYNE